MKVAVVTNTLQCPAHMALRTENVPHDLLWTPGEYEYGHHYYNLWQAREPFVIIEHDIVPWPTAVEKLYTCDRPWCVYAFPVLGQPTLAHGFGIAKYRPVGDAPSKWRNTPWDALDGIVVPFLNKQFTAPHVHTPGVSHVK